MRNGQNLAEFGMIGGLVVGVSVLSFILFSENLSNFFSSTSVAAVFKSNRAEKEESPTKYISGVNLNINNQSYSSPIESVIANKINSNNFEQTSGSSGQIRETLDVISNYVNQVKQLINNPNSGLSGSEISRLQTALQKYETEISNYVALDNNKATSANLKLAQALDVSVNLSINGDTAKNFYDTVTDILTSMPDTTQKKLLSEYSDSILNIGGSLDFKVDSRQLQNLGIQSYESQKQYAATMITNKATEISGSLAQFISTADTTNTKTATTANSSTINPTTSLNSNSTTNDAYTAIPTGTTYVATANTPTYTIASTPTTISALPITSINLLKPTFNDLKECVAKLNTNIQNYVSGKNAAKSQKDIYDNIKTLTELKNKIALQAPSDPIIGTIQEMITKSQGIFSITSYQKQALSIKLKTNTLTTAQIKEIDVYRNGTYQDLAPTTYNNAVLCENIGGIVTNNQCNTN